MHLNIGVKKPIFLKKKLFLSLSYKGRLVETYLPKITHSVGSSKVFSFCKECLCYYLKIIFHR